MMPPKGGPRHAGMDLGALMTLLVLVISAGEVADPSEARPWP
jgi:hypothetical protein